MGEEDEESGGGNCWRGQMSQIKVTLKMENVALITEGEIQECNC